MVKLGEICSVLNGYAFKSEKYVNEGIRIIRITNVQKGYIEDNDPKFYPAEYFSELSKYMLKNGDLLMSLTGNVGRVAILNNDFIPAALNQRVACLRLKSTEILKRYLFHVLNSDYFEQACIIASNGIAQKNLSTEWLKEFEIPVFPLNKQKQISENFDKVTRTIDLCNAILEKLDLLVKARFVEMFGDPVDNPMKWDTKLFLDIGKCKNGMNFHYEDSGVELHCLGVGDFKDLSIINDTSTLSKILLNKMPTEEYLLKNGDIVFVRSNGNKALVGRSLAIYPNNISTTFSGFCIRFRKESDSIIIPYLLRVLKTDSIRKKMIGRGANIQNLNQKILSALEIPIPPIDLQNQFADFVTQTGKTKSKVKQTLEKAETLKKALMQKYFG